MCGVLLLQSLIDSSISEVALTRAVCAGDIQKTTSTVLCCRPHYPFSRIYKPRFSTLIPAPLAVPHKKCIVPKSGHCQLRCLQQPFSVNEIRARPCACSRPSFPQFFTCRWNALVSRQKRIDHSSTMCEYVPDKPTKPMQHLAHECLGLSRTLAAPTDAAAFSLCVR